VVPAAYGLAKNRPVRIELTEGRRGSAPGLPFNRVLKRDAPDSTLRYKAHGALAKSAG